MFYELFFFLTKGVVAESHSKPLQSSSITITFHSQIRLSL